ncbi:MAG: endonuclease domain-containing protein [Saprospiraceae bacterium]|nr:endonuclease domain-containing protein [Saprospiraceae bacterium]
MNPTLNQATELLWVELLQDKQFWGYTFKQLKQLEDIVPDFYCKELKWMIHLDDKAINRMSINSLLERGHHITWISSREIMQDLNAVSEYLSNELRRILKADGCGSAP